jgi:hypothetical protein
MPPSELSPPPINRRYTVHTRECIDTLCIGECNATMEQ